jgi:hypothetical protein
MQGALIHAGPGGHQVMLPQQCAQVWSVLRLGHGLQTVGLLFTPATSVGAEGSAHTGSAANP